MRKQLALFTTVAALAVTPVLAQSSMDKNTQQPATQAQPSQPSGQTTQSPSTSSGQTTQSPSTMPSDKAAQRTMPGEKFVDMQASGQWLASDVIGMSVKGSNNEDIGSVSDLLIDDQGNILAAVVGVGGFLGIGQKDVAISFEAFNIATNKDDDAEARLTLTKEELENAPEFKTAEDTRAASQRPASPATGSKPAAPRN